MQQSTIGHLAVPVSERDHIQGPPTAPVTLVEYGDYECPYCGAAYLVVKYLQRQLRDDLRFVFRNFPLTEIHPHAEQAAEAADAAGAQGNYWEMHDRLFENQQALDLPELIHYANEIGLDVPRFERDLATHAFEPRVLEDLISGARSGVNGTPTFFINGRRHDGTWAYDDLAGAIEARLHATAST
jgi:protein-disulfide isomerase